MFCCRPSTRLRPRKSPRAAVAAAADAAKANEQHCLRPQSVGRVCYCCRSCEGVPFCAVDSLVLVYVCFKPVCVCVRVRQGRRRIPATVRWFSDGSEIAAELWEEWQGWSVWGRGWHRPLPPGLPLQRWMTARGWYQVSSCWHISLIEPHSLHLRTVTHTASHNSLHANRSSRRAVLRARRPPAAKPQGPD